MKTPEDIIGATAVGQLVREGYSIQPAHLDYVTRMEEAWKEEVRGLAGQITTLKAMLRFLREREGECLADHADWCARIDALLRS